LLAGLLVTYLILTAGSAYTTPGVMGRAPQGYAVSNVDPLLNSSLNNQIYDPNFIPGFDAGLQNVSVTWSSGLGYAKIGYLVGQWSGQGGGIPHLAVGPQCCNFVEVPHTQQFRLPSWGDYYYVRAGLGPPGVNVQNSTGTFGGPTSYVGLRTDWNWTVKISLDWSPPTLSRKGGGSCMIGLAATQYVAAEPGKLVYTLVNFWMDQNSSRLVVPLQDGVSREVTPPTVVEYHPLQLTQNGNQTISVDLSWYLRDTLRTLGLAVSSQQPPVVSYVFMNVQGYNTRWNTTLWSFFVVTPQENGQGLASLAPALLPAAVAAAVVLAYAYSRRGRNAPSGELSSLSRNTA